MDNTYRRARQTQTPTSVDGFRRPGGRTSSVSQMASTKRLAYKHRSVGEIHARSAERRGLARANDKRGVPKKVVHRMDMSLPGAAAGLRKQPLIKAGKLRSVRIWALRSAVVALILVVGAGSLLLAAGYWKVHKVFTGKGTTAVALQKNADPALLKGEGSGRINILLLGNGGGTHEAPDLTDTIMVASVDPVNHKADLVSVPRDLWVDVAGYGKMKINAAYETGKYAYLRKIDNSNANHQAVDAGLKVADRTVEQVLGITINYNVLVDFQAFRQAVDTVGGVSVNVPEQLYDPTMAWENGWNPVLAKPGVQTFDGKHALIYVRSRETTSDFARSERQRAVLVALKDKVLSLGTLSNPLKISQLIGAFGDNVQTDLSLDDTNHLVSIGKGIDNSNVRSLGLADPPNSFVTTDHIGNQSVVRPRAGFFNYADIQKYVRSMLVDGYIAKENARIVILNGTANTSLAEQKANELKTYGYNVIEVGNAPTSDYQNTAVVDLTHGKDKYTAHYLQQRFGVSDISSSLPDKTIQTGQADLIIVLGNDETFSSQD